MSYYIRIASLVLTYLLFLGALVRTDAENVTKAGSDKSEIPAKQNSSFKDSGNFVKNGDFEKAAAEDSTRPEFWDKPDGLGVSWTTYPGELSKKYGKAIRMDTSISEKAMVDQWKKQGLTKWVFPKPQKNPIGATYGLSYYSESIPVKKGQAYRITFDFKAPKASAGGKVWVRGYGMYRGRNRRRWETIVFCRVKDDKWTRFSQVFHPTKFRKEVTEMKVMLFAYWPATVYWFDNIKITAVSE